MLLQHLHPELGGDVTLTVHAEGPYLSPCREPVVT